MRNQNTIKDNFIPSARLRSDNRWEARYFDPTVGKYHSVYAKSERESIVAATLAYEKMKHGIYNKPNIITLGEWLIKWYNAHSLLIKYSTRDEYKRYIEKRIAPALGKIRLKYLTKDDIQKFYEGLIKQGRLDEKGGLSPKTIRNIHNMLHAALDSAVNENYIDRNVSENTTLPRQMKKEMQFLNLDDERKLSEVSKGERLGIGVLIAIHTGLRIGEIMALTWDEVDMKKHVISVKKTMRRINNPDPEKSCSKTIIIEDEPKTAKSCRNIPVDDVLYPYLEKMMETQKAEKTLLGQEYKDSNHVICFPDGGIIEPRTYEDFFKRMLKKAKISSINFHSLRHTFAARSIEAGIDLYTLSSLLGHASIQITLDNYAHLSDQGKLSAIQKLSKYRQLTFD